MKKENNYPTLEEPNRIRFMNESSYTKKTIVYLAHRALGGIMKNYEGYELPSHYTDISEEHVRTRTSASVFDSCHKGVFRITGKTAGNDLENVVTCPINELKENHCSYCFILNESGGIIDAPVVYRISTDKFLIVANAANSKGVFTWLQHHTSEETTLTDISSVTGKLDIFGPRSPKVVNTLTNGSLHDIEYCQFKYGYYKSTKILISRTGLTGEIGFEIFCPLDITLSLWQDIEILGIKPAGTGCLHSLQIEMGIPLFCHELGLHPIASEKGPIHIISDKKQYIGSKAITKPTDPQFILSGFIIEEAGSVKKGDTVFLQEKVIGHIISGGYSPSLQKSIALGYLYADYANPNIRLAILSNKKKYTSITTKLPFYKSATDKDSVLKYL